MKTLLLGTLLLMNSTLGLAQEKVGNGGSGDEAQLAAQQSVLLQVAQKIKLFFINNKSEMEKVFDTVSNRNLVETISKMDIEVTNEKLVDRYGKIRTCLNFAGRGLIECNYALLQKIKDDPKANFVLMFHEVLGLMDLEETSPTNPKDIDGYKISKKLALYVAKVSEYDLKLPSSDPDICGLEGSIENRIKNCSTQKGNFALVARTDQGKEVWKDIKSGLIWSDRLSKAMNHYDALKACKPSLPEMAGIGGSWRLPTEEEYKTANSNGIRSSIASMKNHWWWSSSVHRNYSNGAWLFNGDYGIVGGLNRYSSISVRCVAR